MRGFGLSQENAHCTVLAQMELENHGDFWQPKFTLTMAVEMCERTCVCVCVWVCVCFLFIRQSQIQPRSLGLAVWH